MLLRLLLRLACDPVKNRHLLWTGGFVCHDAYTPLRRLGVQEPEAERRLSLSRIGSGAQRGAVPGSGSGAARDRDPV